MKLRHAHRGPVVTVTGMSTTGFLSRLRRTRGAAIVSIDRPVQREIHSGAGAPLDVGPMIVSVRTPAPAADPMELDDAVIADGWNRLRDDPTFPFATRGDERS